MLEDSFEEKKRNLVEQLAKLGEIQMETDRIVRKLEAASPRRAELDERLRLLNKMLDKKLEQGRDSLP
jgi:hypothetical protein